MESFDFIESGIIFGLTDKVKLREFKHTARQFATHGDALSFVHHYFDNYGEPPSSAVLQENFPTLDTSAQTLTFDYVTDVFQKQLLYRQVVGVFQENKELLQENPKEAYSQLTAQLNDIGAFYDDDVILYGSETAITRLQEWKARRDQRRSGDGNLGIPTVFDTVNKTGVGWLKGELISVFARPGIGKTWFMVYTAAKAAMNGHKTLLISTEMPTDAINLRSDVVFANMKGYEFSHKALRSGDPIDEVAYEEFLLGLEGRPLLVCDHIEGQSSITIESINQLIRKHSPDFVVLDGAYLVNSGSGKRAAWEESHALFYGLKSLCTAQNITIMVSTQANRDANDVYAPPQAHTVAFGDALLRASDVLLSLCLIEDQPTRRLVEYQKYRDAEGFTDTSVMYWNPDVGEFYELNADF